MGMRGHRRFLLVVGLSVLAVFAFVGVASHGGTSAAVAAETVEPPRLVTAPAENIRFTQAELVGSVNPHGSPTTYYFVWGTSFTSLPNSTPVMSAGKGTHSETFRQTITGLEAGHEYFFQLVATNAGGTNKGSVGHLVTLKDTTAPVIELSGPLTEGLEEGITEYPLHVHATDGEPAAPQSGVKRVTISVDGEPVKTVEQECGAGSCPLDSEWVFNSVEFPGEHVVTVSAVDFGGNETSESLELSQPDGAIPACDAEGESTSSTAPSEERALEGGGTLRRYALNGGLNEVVVEPPAGFDPLTAGEAELLKYAYPPRPPAEETEALEQWEAEVTASEPSGTSGTRTCSGAAVSKGFPEGFAGALKGGDIWSGYATVGEANVDKWNGVKGQYVQPEFQKHCPDSAEYSWIGLGGFQEEEQEGLLQLGTAIFAKEPPRILLEELEKNGKQRTNRVHNYTKELPISPRDEVYVTLEYRPSSEHLRFDVVDLHETEKEGKKEIVKTSLGHRYFSPVPPSFFEGSSAEFVDERPTIFGESTELAKFGAVPWKGLGVRPLGKSTWPSPASFEHGKLIMKGQKPGMEAVMAEPGDLSANGRQFTDKWQACHP
jgi:Peptidase A4 family